MSGWIVRPISAHLDQNIPLFIVQTVLILAGPPVYAAAEYNVLGRLMHYLPMHAPLNPSRVIYFFIYLGALVEMLTGTGAGQLASAERDNSTQRQRGNLLISISLALQAFVELVFMSFVGLIHHRASKAGMLAPNVRTICITLYCTSALVLFRCIFRAVESFESIHPSCQEYYCGTIANNEWFILVFEALPMIAYTYWLNIMHPGRYLPLEHRRYLDLDGKTERMGPGWIEDRAKWKTFVDPLTSRVPSVAAVIMSSFGTAASSGLYAKMGALLWVLLPTLERLTRMVKPKICKPSRRRLSEDLECLVSNWWGLCTSTNL